MYASVSWPCLCVASPALAGSSPGLRRAGAEGADYISFGPVFPTSTKKDARSPRGLDLLRETRKATTLPIVAIGGITEENARGVIEAGADAVAVISDILLSRDIPGKTSSIISKIGRQ